MGIIDNAVAGALGYAISEMSKSNSLRDVIDQRINRSKQKVTLEDLIDDYARQHGVYTHDNELAHRLHQIAARYEEYNYKNIYDCR